MDCLNWDFARGLCSCSIIGRVREDLCISCRSFGRNHVGGLIFDVLIVNALSLSTVMTINTVEKKVILAFCFLP